MSTRTQDSAVLVPEVAEIAAALIRENGWVRGTRVSPLGYICAEEAICRAAVTVSGRYGKTLVRRRPRLDPAALVTETSDRFTTLADELFPRIPGYPRMGWPRVSSFNDLPDGAGSVDDVLTVLGKIAAG